MTPVSENGPGRTVLDPHEDPGYQQDGGGVLVTIVGGFIALVLLVVAGLIGSHFGYKRGLAQGFEQGLMKALTNAVRPIDPAIEINPGNGQMGVESPDPERYCRAYREAAERTAKLFEDFRKTEAANRANARALGIDEGMRIGREDWTPCGRWESERAR